MELNSTSPINNSTSPTNNSTSPTNNSTSPTNNSTSPTSILQNINHIELSDFKLLVKEWLLLDNQISEREKDIRNFKKRKTKELEPQIVDFMRKYNIKDLNTDSGKLQYIEKSTKQGYNKTNIRENLSNIITDKVLIEQAMDQIINNRTNKITHKLTKGKLKK